MSDSSQGPPPPRGSLTEELSAQHSSAAARPSETSGSLSEYEWPVVADGRYSVSGERARGGLGRILEANDRRLDRSIAVKELLQPENQSEARFVREALVTARLQHPAIVPIYDVGRWPDGKPFYSMKMVSGRSLFELIQELPMLDERLALIPNVIAVADAIAYAHEKKVIHRDLKPSNILIGQYGETLVIDWGLATDLQRSAGSDLGSSGAYGIAASGLTVQGAVLGTPEYMPPEQAKGEQVGEPADVYALGAILYHLLAGGPPYSGNSSPEVLKQLLSKPPLPIERRQPGVPVDLATIVNKAMAREPEARYRTAKEFGEDLRRFQTGQLVNARHYSPITLLARWVRRHSLPVSIAVAFAVALSATVSWSVRRIVIERNLAEARKNELTLIQAQTLIESDPTAALAWLKTYPRKAASWDKLRDIALEANTRQVAKHVLRDEPGNVTRQIAFSRDGHFLVGSGRGGTVRLWEVAAGKFIRTHSRAPTSDTYSLAISPNNQLIASGDGGGTIELWDTSTDTSRVITESRRMISMLTFSPDGKFLGSSSWDGMARLYNLETGHITRLQHRSEVNRVSFSARGDRVLTLERLGIARIWDASHEPHQLMECGEDLTAAAFSPDGTMFASAGLDGAVRLWDVSNKTNRILGRHEGVADKVKFSDDGQFVASAGLDQTVRLWDVAGGPGQILGRLATRASSIHFIPNRASLVAVLIDGSARLWSLDSGEVTTLYGHPGQGSGGVVSHDGHWFASTGSDSALRIWHLGSGQGQVLSGHATSVFHIAFSEDGRSLASSSSDGQVMLWDSDTGKVKAALNLNHRIFYVSFSRAGSTVLIVGEKGIVLWNPELSTHRILTGHAAPVWHAVFYGNKGEILSSSPDGTVRSWNVDDNSQKILYRTEEKYAPRLAVSADGQKLAWATAEESISVRDASGGQAQTLKGNESKIIALALSRDGSRLASAAEDKTMRVWDLNSGASQVLRGHTGEITTIAFSPDGTTLASGAQDSTIRLWDVAGGGKSRTLLGHEAPVRRIAFSPDGALLVSGSGDKTVRMWEVASGASWIVHRHGSAVNFVAFSADGRRIASCSKDQTIWLGNVERNTIPRDPPALRAWMDSLTTAVIDSQNRPTSPQ